MDYQDYNG